MKFLLSFFFALLSLSSYARFAQLEESTWALKLERKVKVLKDGRATISEKGSYFIMSEQGKRVGTLYFTYSPEANPLRFVKAETRNKGMEAIPVSVDQIEDRPIASASLHGFDDTNRLTLNFPAVQVGSELYFETESKIQKPAIQALWSANFYHWVYCPILKGSSFLIESEAPLHHQLLAYGTDIAKKLSIKESFDKSTGLYKLEAVALEDIFYSPIEEPNIYYQESIPELNISTRAPHSYGKTFALLAKKYEDRLSYKEKPALLKKFLKDLPQKRELLEDAYTLMSRVIRQVRYQGDWRTVEGAFVPRSFEVIAKTEHGDCKDFSIMLVALLRELGYESHSALVWRGAYNVAQLSDLPQLDCFNHAIVYAKDKNGKEHFFDPTNSHSYVKAAPYDISGRYSLVLKKGAPFLKEIPETKPEDGTESYKIEMVIENEKSAHLKAFSKVEGLSAFDLSASFKGRSYEEVSYNLASSFVGGSNILEVTHCEFPRELLESNQVPSEIKTEVGVRFFYNPLKTSYGKAHTFDSALSFFTNLNPALYTGGVLLNQISTVRKEERMKNKRLVPITFREVQTVTSPWAHYTRKVHQDGDDILMIDEVKHLKRVITKEELQSKEFLKFQNELREKMADLALIYQDL